MKVALIVTAIVLALFVAVVGVSLAPASPGGAAWDDEDADGHNRLARSLSQEADVRVLESSLALLPNESGPGEMLFAFAAGRAMSETEAEAVAGFVARGGTLVAATDTPGMGGLARGFQVSLHGLPAERVDGEGCVNVEVPVGNGVTKACLPSPTALPEANLETAGVSFSFIARSMEPVFFDLDGDRTLTMRDRAPVHAPLAVGWDQGEGKVIAIADADLWRNRVLAAQPGNTALALALAAGSDTVYLDSTGSEPDQGSVIRSAWLDALSHNPLGAWTPMSLVLAAAVLVGFLPRLRPWQPHRGDPHGTDPQVRQHATVLLQRAYAETPRTQTRPVVSGNGHQAGSRAGGER